MSTPNERLAGVSLMGGESGELSTQTTPHSTVNVRALALGVPASDGTSDGMTFDGCAVSTVGEWRLRYRSPGCWTLMLLCDGEWTEDVDEAVPCDVWEALVSACRVALDAAEAEEMHQREPFDLSAPEAWEAEMSEDLAALEAEDEARRQGLLTDVQYAMQQLQRGVHLGMHQEAFDCVGRALDALERVEAVLKGGA